MNYEFSSALTLGMTGMLRGALDAVIAQSHHTWVLSRHAEETLADNSPPRSTALNVDFDDSALFHQTISSTIDLASIDLAVLWVHNPGLKTLFSLLERFAHQPMRVVHIAGSAAGDPKRQAARIAEKITLGPQCHYCPVILGAMPTPSGRRWLTHEEICSGTIRAIETGEHQMIGHSLAEPGGT